jgi:hypothetical protein
MVTKLFYVSYSNGGSILLTFNLYIQQVMKTKLLLLSRCGYCLLFAQDITGFLVGT